MPWRRKATLNGEGALISADVIDLRSHRLINSGTITGDKVGINTTNNFDNIGGK